MANKQDQSRNDPADPIEAAQETAETTAQLPASQAQRVAERAAEAADTTKPPEAGPAAPGWARRWLGWLWPFGFSGRTSSGASTAQPPGEELAISPPGRRAPRARLFGPHHRMASVCELTVAQLADMDIDTLLVDVDCTLKTYHDQRVTAEVAAWLLALNEAGIRVCLVSNGLEHRIRPFAETLDLPFIAKAMKPLPFALRRAVKRHGMNPRRTAMVGDQLLADVLAGRLAGLRTVMVTALAPEQEPWFTQLKRRPERWLMRWLSPPE